MTLWFGKNVQLKIQNKLFELVIAVNYSSRLLIEQY